MRRTVSESVVLSFSFGPLPLSPRSSDIAATVVLYSLLVRPELITGFGSGLRRRFGDGSGRWAYCSFTGVWPRLLHAALWMSEPSSSGRGRSPSSLLLLRWAPLPFDNPCFPSLVRRGRTSIRRRSVRPARLRVTTGYLCCFRTAIMIIRFHSRKYFVMIIARSRYDGRATSADDSRPINPGGLIAG